MACTNQQDLLDATTAEFAKLSKLLAPLSQSQADLSPDGVSIQNTLGHRAHWIDLFLGWYADGLAGEEVFFPAKGYKWNDLKRCNADLRQRQADLDWAEVVSLLNDRHAALSELISDKSDAELYSRPMVGAKNNWTPGRWAEATGPSHYRSAAKFIRSILRSQA